MNRNGREGPNKPEMITPNAALDRTASLLGVPKHTWVSAYPPNAALDRTASLPHTGSGIGPRDGNPVP